MAEVDGEERDTAKEAAEAAEAGEAEIEVEHLPPGPSEEELARERVSTVEYVPPPLLVPEAVAKKGKS